MTEPLTTRRPTPPGYRQTDAALPGPRTSTDGEMTDPLTTSCGLSNGAISRITVCHNDLVIYLRSSGIHFGCAVSTPGGRVIASPPPGDRWVRGRCTRSHIRDSFARSQISLGDSSDESPFADSSTSPSPQPFSRRLRLYAAVWLTDQMNQIAAPRKANAGLVPWLGAPLPRREIHAFRILREYGGVPRARRSVRR